MLIKLIIKLIKLTYVYQNIIWICKNKYTRRYMQLKFNSLIFNVTNFNQNI